MMWFDRSTYSDSVLFLLLSCFLGLLVYHVFDFILKEPEEVKKPAAAPSPPAEKPGVPKKGTLFFLLFDILLSVLSSSLLVLTTT